MPDYDSKSIPTLDDIIEDENNETTASHEKIIVTDEMQADDNTLDLFNHESARLEVDDTEPRIGAIDKFIDDNADIDIKAVEASDNEIPDDEQPADKTEILESALIDYSPEDKSEKNFEQESDLTSAETETNDSNIFDQQDDPSTDITEPVTNTEPEITLNIDAIIDDVVNQIMPDLEQTLRSRLKQTLQEQLPQDGIEPTTSE